MKLDFLQKRMKIEKQKVIIALYLIIFAATVFLIVSLYSYRGYLFGLKDLDTNSKVSEFYNSNYYLSNLHFDTFIDINEVIEIETTSQQQIAIVGTQGSVVGNLPSSKSTEKYNVYFLMSDDYTIIFCSNHDNIDMSKNNIKVCNKYKDSNVNQDILNKFAVEDNTYVFYSMPNNSGTSIIEIELVIIAISIIALGIINYSVIIQKNSKLGKQLSKIGDYKILVKEINEQAKNPIYKSGNVVVCESYILLLKQNETDVIPIKDIQNISSTPDKNYPDEIIKIEIEYNGQKYYFDVYSKEIEKKIINHVRKYSV